MSDSPQGTPVTQRTGGGSGAGPSVPFSPPSSKRSGGRRRAGRRASEPLASIPSNIQDDDLPMLDSQATGGAAAAAAAAAGKPAARAGRGGRAAGGGGGGGGPEDSDHDMTDADGAHGDENRGHLVSPGGGASVGGSELLPTPGMGMPSADQGTPGHRAGMRSRASSFLPSVNESTGVSGDERIWGTHYQRSEMAAAVRRFMTTFHAAPDPDAAAVVEDDGMATYTTLLRQMMADGHTFVNVDAAHVRQSSPRLLAATVESPEDMLPIWDDVVNKLAKEQADLLQELGLQEPADLLQVRVFNLGTPRPIRDLDPADIDTLVAVRGMVTRTGNISPDLRLAVFRCDACGAEANSLVNRGVVVVPPQCTGCGRKATLRLIPNRSAFLNRQVVKMQEDPSAIPEGETPRSLLAYAFDTNVDAVKPGDRVTLTGVFRATRLRVNPRQRAAHALFKTYLDITHVGRDEGEALFRRHDGAEPTGASQLTQTQAGPDTLVSGNVTRAQLAEKEAQFRAMAADPKHHAKLVASVAPRVIDMDSVKAGLLCQLFGGVSKSTAPAGDGGTGAPSRGGGLRGDINVLVVGDPSVSKSQLLGFVHHVAPRGIYTSGKGSSAVGLTAYVTRDPETREAVLESGALVLSDRGICCIDEFDKMSDGARAVLHEVMEQQTVSVAKAGLVSQLNARTSILACANPKGSRYLPELSLAENINLPPTLLSRFDLVYLVLDTHEPERDRRLARHLVSLFWAEAPPSTQPPYSAEQLREFIGYARATCRPVFTPEAEGRLVESYKELRRQCRNENAGRVAATPRQLEAMIRISEALARMHLRTEVLESDVRAAYRLWHDALSASAADEEGRLDMNLLSGGTSARQAAFLANELPGLLRSLLTELLTARPSVTAGELFAAYNAAYQEQKQARAAAAAAGGGAGAGQDGGPAYRSVTQPQLTMALMQLTDMISMRSGVITRRSSGGGGGGGGGGGAAAAPAAEAGA